MKDQVNGSRMRFLLNDSAVKYLKSLLFRRTVKKAILLNLSVLLSKAYLPHWKNIVVQ